MATLVPRGKVFFVATVANARDIHEPEVATKAAIPRVRKNVGVKLRQREKKARNHGGYRAIEDDDELSE